MLFRSGTDESMENFTGKNGKAKGSTKGGARGEHAGKGLSNLAKLFGLGGSKPKGK